MYLLIGILLFVSCFISRSWIRFFGKDFGIDTWYHLNYAEGFRKEKRVPVKLKHYLLDIEEQWYPPMLALIISLFPKKLLDKYHWLISPLIDSFQAIILYLFSILMTGRLDIAFFATLLYITSTINASMATNLNTRPLASLISTLLMLSIYNFSIRQDVGSFILILLLGVVLLHTHKMATQQFLFFAVGLSILMQNIIYLYIVPLIFILSALVSKGFYIKILKHNIQIVKYWSKNLPYLWKHQIYNSALYADNKKASSMLGVSGMKTHKLMYFLARMQLLVLLFIVIIFWLSQKYNISENDLSFIIYWVLINYFTIIATTYLPLFKYIGEGFKYLIYGTFPVSFLVSYAVINISPHELVAYGFLSILITINLIIQIFTLNRQKFNVNSFLDDELKTVINILKNEQKDHVMCLPTFKAEPVAYLADKKVLWGGHGSGWDFLQEFYPIIKVPLLDLIKKYGINYVLLDKRFVDIMDLKIEKHIKKIFEGNNYLLTKIV